jgi:2-dehydro-3-deoxy-D-arabinonate dehydratase
MRLYKTTSGPAAEQGGKVVALKEDFDLLINQPQAEERLLDLFLRGQTLPALDPRDLVAPVGSQQEIWAAGVTYFRSRDARMEESQSAGGGDFYARVYEAPRPELFMKAAAWRVIGPGGKVRIRKDSAWNVPEPELALVINPAGKIVGYTVGNDMSSRDIEGENPLYLPQAKIYDGSCAIGPAIWITGDKPAPETKIRLIISRRGEIAFDGETSVAKIKRGFEELVSYLYRETSFPHGCVLLTGTGIVPPNAFTLERGDRVDISIDNIGTLTNTVE